MRVKTWACSAIHCSLHVKLFKVQSYKHDIHTVHFADWVLAISCYKCPKKVDIKSFKARSTRCMASGNMRKLQQLPCTGKENFQPICQSELYVWDETEWWLTVRSILVFRGSVSDTVVRGFHPQW